jgi:hypothetical protein
VDDDDATPDTGVSSSAPRKLGAADEVTGQEQVERESVVHAAAAGRLRVGAAHGVP